MPVRSPPLDRISKDTVKGLRGVAAVALPPAVQRLRPDAQAPRPISTPLKVGNLLT
jgi:hypothetical protein